MLASKAVRVLPQDFVKATAHGGFFTVAAYILMLASCVGEVVNFFKWSWSTTLSMDRRDGDKLQINFEIDLPDIDCRNLNVAAFSENSKDRLSTYGQDFYLRHLDGTGRAFGMATEPGKHSAEEIREYSDMFKKEDRDAELDSDWAHSHDGFHHHTFDEVIKAHDLTLINFFAGSCIHSQRFMPTWITMAHDINGKGDVPGRTFADRDDENHTVRLVRINCVDLRKVCDEKGIDSYPTLRLYRPDGNFTVFEGLRDDEAAIVRWLERTIKMKSHGWADNHEEFERGCSAKGRLLVPRVPGHLELVAGMGDQSLNPRMTNVTHLIKHLSFSDPEDGRYHRRSWGSMPVNFKRYLTPLDGDHFVADKPHETWIHDLKIVSTVTPRGDAVYQFQPLRRLKRVPEDDIPQVRFHYDIEPFTIWVKIDSKPWYDFVTGLLAILGGWFASMRVLAHLTREAMRTISRSRPQRRSKLDVRFLAAAAAATASADADTEFDGTATWAVPGQDRRSHTKFSPSQHRSPATSPLGGRRASAPAALAIPRPQFFANSP